MAARTQRTLLEKKNILKAYENLSTDLTKSEKVKNPIVYSTWDFERQGHFTRQKTNQKSWKTNPLEQRWHLQHNRFCCL